AGTFAPRENPLDGQDVGTLSSPTLGDIDGDGDLDVFSGSFDGTFYHYKNQGTPEAPSFVQQTGLNNLLGAFDVGARSAPALSDVDVDGDLDVTSGAFDGTLYYYRNTGTPLAPAFQQQTGSQTNPFYNEDAGTSSAPALGDLDGNSDGSTRPTLVCGEYF